MNCKISIIICVLFYTVCSFAQEIGNPIIRNYTAREYRGLPQVFGIAQDKRGVMYFGNSGIIEYDGISWRSISITDNGNIQNLDADNTGRIYVATDYDFGYLDSDTKGCTVYRSLKPLLKTDTSKIGPVWSVKHTSKFIYFYSSHSVFQYSPTDGEIAVLHPESSNDEFWADFVYNDVYYVLLKKRGLMKVKDQQLLAANQSGFFVNDNEFLAAFPYDEATFLIATFNNGLFLYHPDNDALLTPFTLSTPKFLKGTFVCSGINLGNNLYLLGSIKAGAVLFNKQGKVVQRYNEDNLLQRNATYYIKKDYSTNIWMTLDNGISKTGAGLDLSFWDKHFGLKGNVLSVIRYRGRVYIATTTKIYYIDEKNNIKEVNNIPTFQSYCFFNWNNGKSLLAGTQQGIYEINGNDAKLVYGKGQVHDISESRIKPGRIYAEDGRKLISLKYDKGKWLYEGTWEGIDNEIRGIIEEENGTIWLGTYQDGLVKITPVPGSRGYKNLNGLRVYTSPFGMKYTVKLYTQKEGFVTLTNILPFLLQKQIVCGTGNGLYSYNRQTDRFEPYSKLGKQFCDGSRDVYLLREMPDGKIWICPSENSKADIGYFQPDGNGDYKWVYAPFRRLPEMSIEAMYVEPTGIAWFAGSEGLVRYDMNQDLKDYNQKFNCLIRKVTIAGDSVIFGGNSSASISTSKLVYKYNSIKFEYAAPFFDNEEKTLYSYQLDGSDDAWSTYSRKTDKEYTNLPEGTYTFRVKAKNIYDVESYIASYSFTILPPWYRSWWAYILYIALGIFFISLVVRIYTRRLMLQKVHLEEIVQKRTSEIEQQKIEIESQAEDLRAKNNKLIELDHFKEGMTGMIVHDLKNPLSTILSFAKVPELQQAGKQMLNMVLNILDVQKFENAQIKIQMIDFSFYSCLDEALQQIRYLSDRKAIRIINSITTDCSAKGDYDLIQRVCVNLLTNAIKYTQNNGTITISCQENSENTQNRKILISDTGSGIPAEKLHLIFDKFVQVESKDSGGVRSTGLGLTFCKLAIEAHGGTIGVDSEIGNGSTFWFTLSKGILSHEQRDAIKREIEIQTEESIVLTEEEKKYISAFTGKLAKLTVYEFSEVQQVIDSIEPDNSNTIALWKNKLLNALKACNEEEYIKLIKLGEEYV
ncbi:MAG: ATP-binding protein [Ignavibacteria bacterium]|nr:ATP-binding protein [Ignavibacteria bacterium]